MPIEALRMMEKLEEKVDKYTEKLGFDLIALLDIVFEQKTIYFIHTGLLGTTDILKGQIGSVKHDGTLYITPFFDRNYKDLYDWFRNIYYAKDYGKTWALTKKELKND